MSRDETVIDLQEVKRERESEKGARTPDYGQPVRKIRRQERCTHLKVDVDAELPLAECRDCGERLDPYWLLRQYAHHYDRLVWKFRRLKKLEEDRERRNARARERRAKKRKEGDTP